MTKKDAVHALGVTADLLELLDENAFRVAAYRKAERNLDRFDGDWDLALAARFKGVAGIGAQLGAALVDLHETGLFPPLVEAANQVPAGVLELFRVRGLGPKKARALWLAGIESLADLRAAIERGELAGIKGFGAATQEKLRGEVDFALRAADRRLPPETEAAFAVLRERLAGVASRLEAAGSLRRGCETNGDLDAVAVGDREAVRAALNGTFREDLPNVVQAEVEGLPVEVAVVEPGGFGAALLIMTGSKAFREGVTNPAAERRGLTWRESVLVGPDGSLVRTPEERDAFDALDLAVVPPEWREAEHLGLSVPDPAGWATEKDLRGMVHVHSTWSDGTESVANMARAAQAAGYEYLGLTDHSRTAFYAGGLSIERVREQWVEVDALNGTLDGFRVLKGIECDILPDGALDYPDEVLAGFDFVIASVHGQFGLSQADQTARLVRAASHPMVTIMGHLTGRLLLQRPPFAVDQDAVLEAACAHGTAVEVNANPHRLDLDWRVALRWRERGLMSAICPDAHRPGGFQDVRYGLAVARKAGLRREQILNTRSAAAFLDYARAKRERGALSAS
ncbi:MAG TPA: PHP domain-containing protein [Deinococcales bacterium]|nr:PHP domain-containing protein [Deinococcales bacterium]